MMAGSIRHPLVGLYCFFALVFITLCIVYICIALSSMNLIDTVKLCYTLPIAMRKQKPPKKSDQVCVRINDDDRTRLEKLLEKLQEKYKFLKAAQMLRELMSLEDSEIITQDMRDWLSGKSETLEPPIKRDFVTPLGNGNGESIIIEEKKEA